MNATKRKRLEKAGWIVGSTTEFLDLTPAEESLVEMKLALATKLHQMRKKQKLTQQELADRIGSSQSRVAKMEVADTSVSMELFVKSLVSLGASRRQIGEAISASAALERRRAIRTGRWADADAWQANESGAEVTALQDAGAPAVDLGGRGSVLECVRLAAALVG